jgi:hypothetical protein
MVETAEPGASMLRLLASVATAAALAGCFTSSAPEPDDTTGEIDLALVGQAEDGSVFRLRDATITVSGGFGALTFSTEDDPDRTAITQRLVPGSYSLTLSSTWRLERLAADGTTVPVTALLLSTNPQTVAIEPSEVTRVALRFGVAGGPVELGDGDLAIGVDVEPLPSPAIELVLPTAQIDEGTSFLAAVRLSHPPGATTTVTIESDTPAALQPTPSTVTFTPGNWSSPQIVNFMAPMDADTAHATVTITARIDEATATHAVVEVIDTTLIAVGWPEASSTFTTVSMPTVDLYRVVIDAPLELHRLQVTASAGDIVLGVYSDAGGRPEALLASVYGWAGSIGWPTTSFLDEPVAVAPGTYWLAVTSSQFGAQFANAPGGGVTDRCRSAGGGLPLSLATRVLTCDVAPPIAIAALGRPE